MEIASLARSTVLVLKKLFYDGPLTPGQISIRLKLAPRTVAHALRQLRKYNLCRRRPNFMDLRTPLYYVDTERLTELQIDLDRIRVADRIYFRFL